MTYILWFLGSKFLKLTHNTEVVSVQVLHFGWNLVFCGLHPCGRVNLISVRTGQFKLIPYEGQIFYIKKKLFLEQSSHWHLQVIRNIFDMVYI